jgi:predicted deacylase
MATDSLISCDIDLDSDGHHTGFLRVPHSTHDSAYGWIGLPIVSLRNGGGPVLLLAAGVHGDEYEGQAALLKLARDLAPGDIRGQIILLPMTNAPAARAGRRTSPVDDGNLNRLFPGDPRGTPSQMIAHYLETVLIPRADTMVDLHSGGTSLWYPPTLLRGQGADAQEAVRLANLQAAFDLPYAWVFIGGGGRGSTARTAMGAANRNGVTCVMAELGGGGGLDRDILAATDRGLRRILHALGMLPGYIPDDRSGTRELHAEGSVYARDSGLFEPFVDIGEPVSAGQAMGVVHDRDHPDRPPIPVLSPYAGILLAKRALGLVGIGDAVGQIARDADTR